MTILESYPGELTLIDIRTVIEVAFQMAICDDFSRLLFLMEYLTGLAIRDSYLK